MSDRVSIRSLVNMKQDMEVGVWESDGCHLGPSKSSLIISDT